MSFQSITSNLKVSFHNFYKVASQKIGQLTAKGIHFVHHVPAYMQQNPKTAIAGLAVANTLFFVTINALNNQIDKFFDKKFTNLNNGQRLVKEIIVDGLITGGSVLGFNIALSKVTQFHLSQIALAAITVTAVAVRLVFKYVEQDDKVSLATPRQAQVLAQEAQTVVQQQHRGDDIIVQQ